MKKLNAFTLIELMVVILIVAVLAAAAVPLMRDRIDRSKWSEANTGAGTIRTAVRNYFLKTGSTLTGTLDTASVQQALDFVPDDLKGTYFTEADYEIVSVNADGVAVITVTGSQGNAPSGSKTLKLNGAFE